MITPDECVTLHLHFELEIKISMMFRYLHIRSPIHQTIQCLMSFEIQFKNRIICFSLQIWQLRRRKKQITITIECSNRIIWFQNILILNSTNRTKTMTEQTSFFRLSTENCLHHKIKREQKKKFLFKNRNRMKPNDWFAWRRL